MKTRQQIYGQEATSILRDVTMYRALKEEQLLRLYPGKQDKVQKLLGHLVRQGRISHDKDCGLYRAAADDASPIDRGLLAAVWVLVDKPGQIMEMQVPNANGFCTVSADGVVQYYQKE